MSELIRLKSAIRQMIGSVQFCLQKLRILKKRLKMDSSVSHKIICGLINIQSVENKALDIRELIDTNGLDILMLTETWLGTVP